MQLLLSLSFKKFNSSKTVTEKDAPQFSSYYYKYI